MIHIDIFLFASCLFVVSLLCLIVGAVLRDARARRTEYYQKATEKLLIEHLNKANLQLHNYANIDSELEGELKEAQAVWGRLMDDYSRGRVSAIRHMILYLRGRI